VNRLLFARLRRAKALILQHNGEAKAAEMCLMDAPKTQEEILGALHPEVAKTRVEYGNLLSKQGDQASARIKYRDAWNITSVSLLPQHPLIKKIRPSPVFCKNRCYF
jgi:Tetratricopeptide repeat